MLSRNFFFPSVPWLVKNTASHAVTPLRNLHLIGSEQQRWLCIMVNVPSWKPLCLNTHLLQLLVISSLARLPGAIVGVPICATCCTRAWLPRKFSPSPVVSQVDYFIVIKQQSYFKKKGEREKKYDCKEQMHTKMTAELWLGITIKLDPMILVF